jgi:hypothetical protein
MLAGCTPATAEPSLCELSQTRENYAGRSLTIEGVLLASRHGHALIDPSCGRGIGIEWTAHDVPRMSEFNAAVERSLEPGQDMMATARVTGTVTRSNRSSFGMPTTTWVLKLTDADVLESSGVEQTKFLDWLNSPRDEPFRAVR